MNKPETSDMLPAESTGTGGMHLNKTVPASACGKAILVGEHAVVHGSRAVAMPLMQTRLHLEVRPVWNAPGKPLIRCKLGKVDVSDRIGPVVEDAFALIGETPMALQITGHSDIPIGAGLGSSASLCVATLRALCRIFDRKPGPDSIAAWANRMEERFHGQPSGLDAAVVARQACIAFRKGAPVEILDPAGKTPGFWNFAVIDSGMRASTKTMVNQSSPWFQAPEGNKRIARFDDLAGEVVDGLMNHNRSAVAAAMNEAGHLLGEAGVVTPRLQEIMDESRRHALAAKPTGAGGGGVILVLLDGDRAGAQLAALRRAFPDNTISATSM